MAKRRQFYQLSPVCYRVSLWKEGLRKSLADRRSGFRAAELRQEESLPVIVKSHRSPVLRRLEGVDMALQQSKRANLALAAGCIDGVVIRPVGDYGPHPPDSQRKMRPETAGGDDTMNLEDSVRALLVQACGTQRVLQPGADLLEEELLDSLAFIELLEGLEDLGITLQPTRIPKDRFRTVDSILALVREYAG
ncbi:acyl carrier protein [Pseudoflavonifractor phocaeensis]|uniref:acyl carrier protein n=1 Tax=Pseudoflavonifractor phocaeensis TaxID=1870988 RepID=UPI00195DF4CF|nr:acyl carrier protein [Pseudoflavonifractor phocaeensis]MBM6885931.1 acyl carrier protein [Pseudoflavonifractor phocaeensis]